MAMNVEIPRFRQGHDEFEINDIDMCMAAPAALYLPMNMCQMRCRMAAATSSIQWTYSAFWRLYPETQALGWYEGYYSGSIKFKCDLHGSEISSEEFGLWRSQQLKELYATIRSSSLGRLQTPPLEDPTALNPEELTELEWFYLNCMSLSFPPGVGLPGRALANRRHVWHCATGELNSRVFLRATIAQKARIQTVVCIPILDGVLEFGTTSLVKEDPALLLQMQAPFLEVSNQPTPGFEFAEIFDLKGGAEHHHELGVRLDDPVTPEDVIINTWKDRPENGNPEVMRSPSSGAFKSWRKRSLEQQQQQQQFGGNPQWMLKKALMTFPHLSAAKNVIGVKQESEGRRESEDSEWNQKTKARRTSDLGGGHVMAERRRREKLNDRFVTLRTLVPFVTKSDKVSLLGDAIEYVKELQQRVREIQPGRCQAETTKKKGSEYINKETSNAERKPKVTDANYKFSQQGDQCVELESYKDRDQASGCLPVEVTMEEDVAVLRICCPGRSSLLIDILQKFVNLQLEVFSVKAAITKGILTTILKAKVKSSQRYDSQKSKEMQAALLHIVEDLRRRSTKSTFSVEQ